MRKMNFVGGARKDWIPNQKNFLVELNGNFKLTLPQQFDMYVQVEHPKIFIEYNMADIIIYVIFVASKKLLVVSMYNEYFADIEKKVLSGESSFFEYRQVNGTDREFLDGIYNDLLSQLNQLETINSLDDIKKISTSTSTEQIVSSIHCKWAFNENFPNIIVVDQCDDTFSYEHDDYVEDDHIKMIIQNTPEGLFNIMVVISFATTDDEDGHITNVTKMFEIVQEGIMLSDGIHSIFDYVLHCEGNKVYIDGHIYKNIAKLGDGIVDKVRMVCGKIINAYEDFNTVPIQLPPVII